MNRWRFNALLFAFASALATQGAQYDSIIRNGTIYDGAGGKSFKGDIAITNHSIAVIGNLKGAQARNEIDAAGMAVAPGFINMLSWADESLIQDGRSQSDLRQGVTLEVFGEGTSMGPLNEAMKTEAKRLQGDIKYDITWTTLGEYLDILVKRGISCNVGSFVGATTVRIHEVGYADRVPTKEELGRMQELVRQAMCEGALGVGSSLIYAPAFYARTDELVALCKAAAPFGGMYISHIRSEGNRLLEAADELLEISRGANIRAEFYHLKAAGKPNWDKEDALLKKIADARAQGLQITADMYNYVAAGTGLDATMPPWVQEGGLDEWIKRLKDPAIRAKVKQEMDTPSDKWENFFLAAGSPEKIIVSGFKTEKLKTLTGKTLAEVARLRGTSPEETGMDLVIEDHSRVDTIYFLMSEENVRKQLQTPWISFGSDEASLAPEGVFLKANPHPRAYGNVARLLGKYVREEKVLSLEEAVHRLSGLPSENLRLKNRGALKPGYFADVVIFNPATIQDHATFDKPHQYATGVRDVFVNGVQVLTNGEHTGAKPGQVVRGPGYQTAGTSAHSPPGFSAPLVLTNAHAHNDYRHKHPLFDALTNGFSSVEADIYLVDGKLLVAHDRSEVKPNRTLQSLYLDPLRARIQQNGGRVYANGPEFTLLIDLKQSWKTLYAPLSRVLSDYSDVFTSFSDGKAQTNAVTAIITGDRSPEMFNGQKVRYAAMDGTLDYLDSNLSTAVVPWISSNWYLTFNWSGRGVFAAEEKQRLNTILSKAHAKGRRVRFWGGPDEAGYWTELLGDGVDLINTDDLSGFQKYSSVRAANNGR